MSECSKTLYKTQRQYRGKQQQSSYKNPKICYICQENVKNIYLKNKKYCNIRDHFHYTEEYRSVAHSISNLKYSVPKYIPIIFHNGSNYDYHFIIKELAEKI